MVTLETVNLALDVVLKMLFLAGLIYLLYIVRKMDNVARSLEKAAKNVERSSDTIDDVVSVLRKIPFIGPRGA
ncbi:MAG: hypothetical protein ABEJ72_09775, partial [Candidatus Aenigmatarchaeota archaeon]